MRYLDPSVIHRSVERSASFILIRNPTRKYFVMLEEAVRQYLIEMECELLEYSCPAEGEGAYEELEESDEE